MLRITSFDAFAQLTAIAKRRGDTNQGKGAGSGNTIIRAGAWGRRTEGHIIEGDLAGNTTKSDEFCYPRERHPGWKEWTEPRTITRTIACIRR